MADTPLSTKSGIDTTDFKTGVAEMNRELRVLESGFRASAASLGDWSKDATGLEYRIKSLGDQMEIQQRKVAATRAEYERIKAEKGETSRAAQDLEIKLNKETETLGKMGVELRTTESALQELESGSDEAGESVDDLGNEADETGGKMEGFKSVLGGVGAVVQGTVGLVLGLVAAVAAVAGVIGGLVFATATASGELVDLSSKTGISTTRLQEMEFIGHQVGVSLDTMTGAQARLIRSMSGASDETDKFNQKIDEANADPWDGLDEGEVVLGDIATAFKILGVSVTDESGNLRDNQEVFAETIDALGKIENPAERDALAMQIFGKSAQELNPLIKAGSGELATLADKAHEVGAVMSEEDVAAFEAFDDTLAALKDGLKGTLGTLASAFLPGFQAVFDQVGGYLKTFTDIVSGADGDFGKIAEGLTGLVEEIATDIAAQAPQMLAAGLSIVKSILDAIISALPSMLTAGIEIIKTLINFIVENLPLLIDSAIQLILFLVDAIISNLPLLIGAALQAIIALANGLSSALPVLIPSVVSAILAIVDTLILNLPLLIDAALALLQALAEGLIIALPTLIAAIPQIVKALSDALINASPSILSAAGKLIGTLALGILSNIPVVYLAMLQLIGMMIENLMETPGRALEAGISFVEGLVAGIENASGLLFEAIANLVEQMIAELLGALGINSPSTVGKGIGKNFIGSMALGGLDVIRDVEMAFAAMAGRMSTAAAVGISTGNGNISTTQSEHNTFYGPSYFSGAAGRRISDEAKGRRF